MPSTVQAKRSLVTGIAIATATSTAIVTSATAAAASATAVTTTATAASAATARWSAFAFPSLIARDTTIYNRGIVQVFDCSRCFIRIRHFNERKASRSVGFTVNDDADARNFAVLLKCRSDIRLSGLERKISNVNIGHKTPQKTTQTKGVPNDPAAGKKKWAPPTHQTRVTRES
jgi:hypothetical protein